jgi:hypothetical protein
VGQASKGIAARTAVSESDRLNDCEANDLGNRQEEDRGGTAGTVGKNEGGEECE